MAVVLFIIASGFAFGSTANFYGAANAPIALGLASLGFAVAGGFALLADAVVKRDR